MKIEWRNGSDGMRQAQWTVPGYDCRKKCEHEKKGEHGWHADDWMYAVGDGRSALSITVFSSEFAASPELTNEYRDSISRFRRPSGLMVTDMSLHVPAAAYPDRETWETEHDCDLVEGPRCVTIFSSTLCADEFWAANARWQREQDEFFWLAMESKFCQLLESRAPSLVMAGAR